MKKASPQPQWGESDTGRVRVLLECPPADSPSIIASAIERRGYAVAVCEGPSTRPCDLLERGACPLVDGADVVVNMLGATPREASVLPAVVGLRRPPALLAQCPRSRHLTEGPGGSTAVARSLEATVKIHPYATTQALIGGIEEALRVREQRVAWWGDGFC